MRRTLWLLCVFGCAFIFFACALGYIFHLETGSQVYKLLAIAYLCIPGLLAVYLSHRNSVTLSLKNTRPWILALSLTLPLILLVFAMGITFALSLDEAKDSLMLAPMHGLTIKHKVLQIAKFGSNIALLTLFYGLTLQFVIALGEEVMWRGYFLSLLSRFGFWTQSILLGLLSGLWHVPLIVLFGWLYPEHFILGPVWMISLSLLLSPILLHLKLATDSLLAPALFHAFFYSMASLFPYFMSDPDYLVGGMTGIAGFIALFCTNILLIPLFNKKVRKDHLSMV